MVADKSTARSNFPNPLVHNYCIEFATDFTLLPSDIIKHSGRAELSLSLNPLGIALFIYSVNPLTCLFILFYLFYSIKIP